MKKKIAGLVVLITLMATTTFARNIEDGVNRKVLTSFTQTFTDAKDVKWTITEKYVKASFKMNDQLMFAFFTETGDLMGISRNLTAFQLPIKLQTELSKDFSDRWITELFEIANEDGTTYYATIENANQKLKLRSAGSYSWSVYKKIKKD